jgi:hypothetical protein
LLTAESSLRTPDEAFPYKVVTDALDIGLGPVLLHEGHHVAFESKKLNSGELNNTAIDKEMLSVIH